MTELHITWVDLAVVTTLIVSIAFAIYRGFVRETLSVFAWAAAAFAALYFGHYLVPPLTSYMSMPLARVAAYSIAFLLVLLPLLLIAGRLSRRVQDSAIGALDRTLGAVFGAVRGLGIIAVVYILYSLVVPVPSQAKWMQQARTLPLIQKSASVLLALLPDNDARYLQERTQDTRTAGLAESPPPTAQAHAASDGPARHKSVQKGYGAAQRHALNRLIEATGNAGR